MQLSSRNKGILLLLISSFGFALISLFVRPAGDVPTMEKTLYRNVVSALVISIVLLRSGTPFRLPRECRGDMFLRCFFGYTGMICYLWSIDHMGLADANMLSKTSPFFSVLMSIWILKERPSFRDILCIVVAVIGAALVALGALVMLIGFWKTLILAALFTVGYFLGTVENKSEFMKNAANKLIPDKEAKVIDFKTELAREQEQVQAAAEEADKSDENKE